MERNLDENQRHGLVRPYRITQADYLSVIISAIENVSNDAVAGTECDGHYADGLSISAAVPAPPSSMLIIAGLARLAGAAARRRAPR